MAPTVSRNPRTSVKRRTRAWLCIVAASALIIGFLSWWLSPNYRCVAVETNGTGALLLNVNPLARGTAKKYCWRDRAQTVRFIVARRSDGMIEVVLDACKTCYRNHLGYRISRGVLVCRFCGNRYALDKLHDGMMSCRALELPFTVDRGIVKLRIADLRGSARYFPPSVVNRILTSPFRLLVRLARAGSGSAADARKPGARIGSAAHQALSTIMDN